MSEPRTKTGRELLADYHERMHENDCECDASFIREPILAIEREAAAPQTLDVVTRDKGTSHGPASCYADGGVFHSG